MKLSIIIPVFNEEKTIQEIINRVEKTDLGERMTKEIIVIDDGSTDKTKKILREISTKARIRVFTHQKNQGKGAAVRRGIKESIGDIILIQDADLEYSPSDYPKLLEPIISKKAQIVYGNRMWLGVKPEFYFSFLGNKLLTGFTNLLFKSKLSDVFVCYKVFKKEVLKGIELKSNGFNIEIELTAKFLKKKIKIQEIPISYQGRGWNEGKKISFWDGLVALFNVFYYRFFD
ncbi:glycosyltransferase family 2 protein [Candidatus Microgenomates bacterium]|nr:glycosyltransferase family 2 protein [Candidatus Microgenomates bacterium]